MTSNVEPIDATHALVLTYTFHEGDDEHCVLMYGQRWECERNAEQVPAVAYSGERPLKSASIGVWPIKLEEP